MNDSSSKHDVKPSLFAKLDLPKSIAVTDTTKLVRNYILDEERSFPYVFQAKSKIQPISWIEQNILKIKEKLTLHGAVILRDFDLRTAEDFDRFVKKFGTTLPYKERSSPRSKVAGNVYTSTEYPPDQEIFFHNENSYANSFPQKIYFCCMIKPASGGSTPLSDVRRVLDLIPREIVEKFERKGILYVRNFRNDLGLPWQEVFQTNDSAEVERVCRIGGYRTFWNGENLRTTRVGQAVAEHPQTGESVWFNHAAFFHISTHRPEVREALLKQFAPETLPHNTFYGDGEKIEPEVPDILRQSYRRASVSFAWQERDILLVDNVLMAHAREPFSGQRRILVAMTD